MLRSCIRYMPIKPICHKRNCRTLTACKIVEGIARNCRTLTPERIVSGYINVAICTAICTVIGAGSIYLLDMMFIDSSESSFEVYFDENGKDFIVYTSDNDQARMLSHLRGNLEE